MTTTDKPKIHDNLDSWENENVVEPYAFVLSGRRWLTANPSELDWRDLAGALGMAQAGEIRPFLQLFIVDHEQFAQQPLPIYKLTRLMERIIAHYGIEVPGGNSVASSAG